MCVRMLPIKRTEHAELSEWPAHRGSFEIFLRAVWCTQRNLFEFLLNRTEIRLYLTLNQTDIRLVSELINQMVNPI